METSFRVPKTRSRTGCFTCRKRKKKCDELLYPICQNCQEKKLACQWPLKKHEVRKKLEEIKYIGYEDSSKAGGNSGNLSKKNSAQRRIHNGEAQYYFKKAGQDSNVCKDTNFMPIKPPSGAIDFQAIDTLESIPFKGGPSGSQDAAYMNSIHEMLGRPDDSSTDQHDNPSSDIENYSHYVDVRHLMDSKLDKPYRVSKNELMNLEKKRHNYFLERIAMQQDCVDSDEDSHLIPIKVPLDHQALTQNDCILNDKAMNENDYINRTHSPVPKTEALQDRD